MSVVAFAVVTAVMAGFFAAKIIWTVIYFFKSIRYKKRIPIKDAEPKRMFIMFVMFVLLLIIPTELLYLYKYGEWYAFTETVKIYLRTAYCSIAMLILIFEAAFGARAYITEDGILTQAAFYPKNGAKYGTETDGMYSYILLYTKKSKNVSKARSDFAFIVKPKDKSGITAIMDEYYEKFDGTAPKLKKRSYMKRYRIIFLCTIFLFVSGLFCWYAITMPVVFVGDKIVKTDSEYALFDNMGFRNIMFRNEFNSELTEIGDKMYDYIDSTENLTSKDMAALKKMPNLKYLSVYGNNITDLSDIGSLTQLEGLAFGARINNDIPEDYLPLKNLTNLKYFLGAGLENFHDLTVFENADELIYFELTCADIQNGLDAICEKENLLVLDLFRCTAEDFSPIGKCVNLKSLALPSTNVADLSFLKNLTELEVLYISDIDADDYSVLLDLPKLKHLIAENCDIPTEISSELIANGVEIKR